MSGCLSSQVLVSFLAGELAQEPAAELAEHLLGCQRCRGELERLSDSGELRRWVRSTPAGAEGDAGERYMQEAALVKLIGRLRKTPPSLGSGEATPAPDASVGEPAAVAASAAAFPFLGPPAEPGELGTLGRYRILAVLGRGGMGVVFKGYDPELARTVALKVLAPEQAAGQARARFVQEGRAAAGIRHENVVTVYHVENPSDGPPCLAMEYVSGPTLRQRIAEQGCMVPREAATICGQVARGLAAAHAQGLVHRDVKPSNILVDPEGSGAKVADFGLVRATEMPGGLTRTGVVLGTPEYMSPEQVQAPEQVDQRTDVYGLGVTLYEALTGEVPFRGVAHMVIKQVLDDEPRAPRRLNDAVPRDLETICLKAMAKEPGRRYRSAAALADDLDRWLRGEPIHARPVGPAERLWRWCRRNPTIASLAATAATLLILLVTGATVAAVWFSRVAEERRVSLVRSHVAAGVRFMDEGDLIGSLPFLTEALRLDQGDRVREEAHRIRIAAILRSCPDLVQMFFHERPVRMAVFGPDGAKAAVASGEVVVLWDVAAGRPILKLSGHTGRVFDVSFSGDGRRIATASADGTACVWDAASGKLIAGPLRHAERVIAASFNQDSSLLVTASYDGTARVWDAATGQPISPPLTHDKPVNEATFSPDGRRVATASEDGTARLWDTARWEAVWTLPHEEPVLSVQFSRDGRGVVTASRDGTAKVWDAVHGKLRCTLRHSGFVYHASFSPDGRRVVTASEDHTACVWDAETGRRLVKLLHKDDVGYAEFSRDGRRVVTASDDETARVWGEWDLATWGPLTPPLHHADDVNYATFSPDGGSVITASDDYTVRVWKMKRDGGAERVFAHSAGVKQALFSPDGRWIATLSGEEVLIWSDIDRASPRFLFPHAKQVNAIAFSPNGQLLVTAGTDGMARLWDLTTGKRLFRLRHNDQEVTWASFSPDADRVVTTGADAAAVIWDARTGQALLRLCGHNGLVYYAEFSPDGRRVVTASQDKTARVWDIGTTSPHSCILQHKHWVHRARFSPDSRRVVTACLDGTVCVWDAHTGRRIAGPLQHGEDAPYAEFDPSGELVATASWDQTARVWEVASGRLHIPPLQHNDDVYHVSFSPDGRWLVTASRDQTARVWDARTGQALTTPLRHDGAVYYASFSPDSRRLVTGSADGKARLLTLHADGRPVGELRLLAQLLSGSRVDGAGGALPLRPSDLRDAWVRLRLGRHK